MNKSEHINELAAALSELQGEITDAYKGREGYGYRYADLNAVLEVARPLLNKYKLAICQMPCNSDDKIALESVIMHASGQWMSSTLAFKLPEPVAGGKKKNSDAQDAGSLVTYMRRYSLTAMLGITQTDDDATQVVPISAKDLSEIRDHIISQEISEQRVNSWLQRAKVESLYMLSSDQAQKLLQQLRIEENNLRNVEANQTQWEDSEGA